MTHKISLTDFVDIVHRAGTSKATHAQRILGRGEYRPFQDYYRPLREHIVEVHANDQGKAALQAVLLGVSDNKQDNYARLVESYSSWWGNKRLSWFQPPRGGYTHSGITVNINPELGLRINGVDHVIKLYFKSEKLAQSRANIILGLMDKRLKTDATMSVLDISRKKLFKPTIPIPNLKQIVNGELAYLAAFLPA